MLTDPKVKKAAPRDVAYSLPDSGGLYLYVTPAGTKSWCYKFRFGGKEKLLVIRRYPDSLVEAASIGHVAAVSATGVPQARAV